MTKHYRGYVNERRDCVVTVDGADLPLRLDLDNHSPTGFAWGYGGSGPAQLALALLADALGDEHLAVVLHQRFKWKYIATIPRDAPWTMTSDVIRDKAMLVAREVPNIENRLDALRRA